MNLSTSTHRRSMIFDTYIVAQCTNELQLGDEVMHIPPVMLHRLQCQQGFVAEWLKSSLQKFFGRHHELVNRYETSLSFLCNGLTMAIMAGVSREAVDAHSADKPGLTLVFMGP